MPVKTLLWPTVLLALLVAMPACRDNPQPPPVLAPPPDALQTTPKPDSEAELAALWLSGEIVAPDDLYETIKQDLEAIRAAHGDDIDALDITFFAPWVPSQLLIAFDDDGVAKIRSGSWPELEALNDQFELAVFDTTRPSWRTRGAARLEFEGRRHPVRMATSYAALPEVVYAEPNGYIGDWSNVYPGKLADGMSYLWREASGDCPAGCINSHFWYFRVTDSGIDYVGNFEWDYATPPPDWWNEAKAAYEGYWTH
jgi:hypothetical protein